MAVYGRNKLSSHDLEPVADCLWVTLVAFQWDSPWACSSSTPGWPLVWPPPSLTSSSPPCTRCTASGRACPRELRQRRETKRQSWLGLTNRPPTRQKNIRPTKPNPLLWNHPPTQLSPDLMFPKICSKNKIPQASASHPPSPIILAKVRQQLQLPTVALFFCFAFILGFLLDIGGRGCTGISIISWKYKYKAKCTLCC